MTNYKNSGIEWIGDIPKNWKVNRLKIVLQERNENNNPIKTDYILSLTNDRGVIPYTDKGEIGNKSKDDISGYKLAYPNDIVLNSMNVIIGSVGISKYYGAVSPVYYMLKPRYDSDDVRFYNYIFQTNEFQNRLKGYGNGILEIRMRIQMLKLNTVELPIPPSEEQFKIANFLDRKCSQIDALISLEEKEIEKLKEYKTAVITKMVTKGLENSVSMKDTGIPWIGEIPEHWNCGRLKFFYLNRNAKFDGSDVSYFALENIESWSGVYIDTNSEYDKTQSNMVYAGDVVFGKLRPYLAKSLLVKEKQCCSSEFAIFYDKKGTSAEYLHYLMLSHWFVNIVDSSTYGTKMPRASIEFIKNMIIPYPSYDEQKSICDWIKVRLSQINNLIILKNKKIEELKIYKKSMIYEYVTGKKRCV